MVAIWVQCGTNFLNLKELVLLDFKDWSRAWFSAVLPPPSPCLFCSAISLCTPSFKALRLAQSIRRGVDMIKILFSRLLQGIAVGKVTVQRPWICPDGCGQSGSVWTWSQGLHWFLCVECWTHPEKLFANYQYLSSNKRSGRPVFRQSRPKATSIQSIYCMWTRPMKFWRSLPVRSESSR